MAEELINGFTGFAKRKPGFVPASATVGRTPVGGARGNGAAGAGARGGAGAAQGTNLNPWSVGAGAGGAGSVGAGGDGGAYAPAADGASFDANEASLAFNSVKLAKLRAYMSPRPDGQLMFDPDKLAGIDVRDRRWSWVEIDLSAIRANIAAVRTRMRPGTRLLAVVKADAYGHGAVRVAKTALASGADYLGVATVDEAIELREASVFAPILILSQPPIGSIPLLLAYKIMPAVYTAEFAIQYAEAADALGVNAPYHLAVNTGMNRIGVHHEHVVEFLNSISFHRALEQVGTFTHYAVADEPETFELQLQTERFLNAVEAIRQAGYNPGIVHAAASAALLRFPDVHFDMVRLGIALYGLHPSQTTRTLVNLQPAMSVHARITDARELPMGEGVSYGLHYRSGGRCRICTIPVGYADGLARELSGRCDVIVGGRRFHQVGNICMDQCMFEVDLRNLPRGSVNPHIGDEVLIIGRQGESIITADDHASLLGTINYEITCRFGLRIPRVYR